MAEKISGKIPENFSGKIPEKIFPVMFFPSTHKLRLRLINNTDNSVLLALTTAACGLQRFGAQFHWRLRLLSREPGLLLYDFSKSARIFGAVTFSSS